jgi:hypothetical protein
MTSFPSWTGSGGGGGGGGRGDGGAGDGGSSRKEAYLAWGFGEREVRICSWEGNAKAEQVSTEFFVKDEQFDEYNVFHDGVNLGFPMRDFKVQLSFPCIFSTSMG